MPGFVTRNWRLKLLATFLAVVSWAVVVYAGNPPGIRAVTVSVPQDPVEDPLPSPYILIAPIPDITVDIAATQDHLNAYNKASLVVRVDYAAIRQAGFLSLPISVTNNDPNCEIEHAPSYVVADVDKSGASTANVQLVVSHSPPPGFTVSAETVTPGTVTLTGPEHEFSGLQVRATVNLSDQRANYSASVNLIPYDAQGRQISDVNINPATADVEITVNSVSTDRSSAVTLGTIRGQPASGYEISSISMSPMVVVLAGSQELLNDPSLDSVTTDGIDVTGLSSTRSYSVGLVLPDGVTATPGTVLVTVTVSALPIPTATPTPSPSA
jgi:YbbR domain-containing protein